jgi:hypothetical protein
VFALQLALPPAPGTQETADQILVSTAQPVERASDSRTVSPADEVQQLAAAAQPVDPIAQQRLQEYIAQMATRENQPMRTEHLQESPLYRLVSETVELPLRR